MPRNNSQQDPLKEVKKKLQAIENLLILQLIQNGASAKQIETVLQIESVTSANIRKSFPIKELKIKDV